MVKVACGVADLGTPCIDIFDEEGGNIILSIFGKPSLYEKEFDIEFSSGQVSKLRRVSRKKIKNGHYRGLLNEDTYDVYIHRQRNYSVFKNGQQIARWKQSAITILSGDKYEITANDNCNIDLLISYCLILDILDESTNNMGDGALLTINFGNIGPDAIENNPEWEPNKNINEESNIKKPIFHER